MIVNKVVVAMDSFKGSLSAIEATEAVARAISDVLPLCSVDKIPLSDGGDGLVSVLVSQLDGNIRHVETVDALMRPVSAKIGIVEGCAIIEMAESAGLALLASDECNPLNTTTYGVGMMMRAALDMGYRRLLVGLGGSATNDAGIGAMQAVGLLCFDSCGRLIKEPVTGAMLVDVDHFDLSVIREKLSGVDIRVVCDVKNPFSGCDGAAYVYAPQKGASVDDVIMLDIGLKKVAQVIRNTVNIDVEHIEGAGAAGGMGGALAALTGAAMVHGIGEVLDLVHFNERIEDADLVITGEGSLDCQSLMGKVVMGVVACARSVGVPVLAVAGKVDNRNMVRKMNLIDALAATPVGIAPEIYMRPEIASDYIYRSVKRWLDNNIRTS